VIVAEPGEAIRPGQPVLTLEVGGERWFAFNVREDRLVGFTLGTTVRLGAAPDKVIPARITEIRGLGEFATWRAARAVGDHDLNTFRVRAEPIEPVGLDPGVTVWLDAPVKSSSH
jgi:HlyD family secretion protein